MDSEIHIPLISATLDHLPHIQSFKSSDCLLPHLHFWNVLGLLTPIPSSHRFPPSKNFPRRPQELPFLWLKSSQSHILFLEIPFINLLKLRARALPKASAAPEILSSRATLFLTPLQLPLMLSGHCSSILLEKNTPLMFMPLAHYGRLKFSLVFIYSVCSLI